MMRTAPPQLTPEQRRLAYERSLELRQTRAMLKEALKIEALHLSDAWRMEAAQGMKVYDLLVSLPGVAQARALRILVASGIPEHNTVRACGHRQRARLFEVVHRFKDTPQSV